MMPPAKAPADRQHRSGGELRILIVGAGIAGASLAALLAQGGGRPMVVERQPERPAAGYMLGLLPLGGRVIDRLGLRDAYLEHSCPMRRYVFHGADGAPLKDISLERIVARFGAYRGIERGLLLDLLRSACGADAIRYGRTVQSLEDTGNEVRVRFDNGSVDTFDLVVGADGMHSDTRHRILNDQEVRPWHTGWGGWVFWIPPLAGENDTYREFWGAGYGVGLYPVRDRCGIFAAGRVSDLADRPAAETLERLHARMPDGVFRTALERVDPDDEGFFWEMEDRRAAHWSQGRTVLLGDAATGFLPTAGVGASMAMDGAAALADELLRSENGRLDETLARFERRQRPRAEATQANSRRLARFMFVNSRPGAALRDIVTRFYPADWMLRDIERVMEER
jgi:2-polyprenyl-6-methoxyphenol hydroxylase-like FAD-dependent oxidoreductase